MAGPDFTLNFFFAKKPDAALIERFLKFIEKKGFNIKNNYYFEEHNLVEKKSIKEISEEIASGTTVYLNFEAADKKIKSKFGVSLNKIPLGLGKKEKHSYHFELSLSCNSHVYDRLLFGGHMTNAKLFFISFVVEVYRTFKPIFAYLSIGEEFPGINNAIRIANGKYLIAQPISSEMIVFQRKLFDEIGIERLLEDERFSVYDLPDGSILAVFRAFYKEILLEISNYSKR